MDNKDFEKRIKSEQAAFKPIRNNDLVCKDCKYRHDDSKIAGNTTSCDIYPNHTKPNEVIKGGKCPYYDKEKGNG